MKILHITPNSNGYEEVELLANRISKTNHLALILKDGKEYMTGGLLISDTPENREALDSMPREIQYKAILALKTEPFVKPYAEEN